MFAKSEINVESYHMVEEIADYRYQEMGLYEDHPKERSVKSYKIRQRQLISQNDELKSIMKRLEESEKCYKNMYRFAPVAYITLDNHAVIQDKNLKAVEMLGTRVNSLKPLTSSVYKEDRELFRHHIASVFADSNLHSCEIRLVTKGGEIQYSRIDSVVLMDRIDHCLTTIIDIHERKTREETINQMAYYDHLTGLPNRAMFMERLNDVLQGARQSDEKFALLFIDLDNFKTINDTLGHETGDNILKEVSRKMQDCMRETDILSRLGGDEFILIIQSPGSMKEVETITKRLLKSIRSITSFQGRPVELSASIGISIFPEDGYQAEVIINNADMAMYQSKQGQKNTYCFFNK